MKIKSILKSISFACVLLAGAWGCKAPVISFQEPEMTLPDQYSSGMVDSLSAADIDWRVYFDDENLTKLIDSALINNQELNIVLQELMVRQNEVLEKSGEYRPNVKVGGGLGSEKAGRFTRDGAVEHSLEIDEGKEFPEPLNDFFLGAAASWEVDIWRKMRNARDAAQLRYLAENEGRNFLITQLVAEIAESYYELMALDNQLDIINQNVAIQESALEKMIHLKENAKANQLAVNRFEAQVLNTKNQQFDLMQKRVETENRLHFLTGTFSGRINRRSDIMMSMNLSGHPTGYPAQLLRNRSDVRQAELNMAAARLDVRSARADFFPGLDIKAGLGFQAFNPIYLLNPESLIFNLGGDLIAPVVNRRAIQARFNSASALQVQSVYTYEQTLLQAYVDVLNQLAKAENFANSFDTKAREVAVLNESVEVANSLFQYAKADYVEVLLTQEEVLDAHMELVEARLGQLKAHVQIYRALGGGWK